MNDEWANQIHEGDVLGVLAEMPGSSVHMAMCSPPYYGLRDYGADGQIGLEDSLDDYIQNLVNVGDELRRVLRPDGSWWLNLGDSFDNKQKQLVPHRTAIALQEAGWVVRADCVWAKPNPMPQSVKDRLNETKEYVFHLTPNPDYYFDLDAIREPCVVVRNGPPNENWVESTDFNNNRSGHVGNHPSGKNPGDVFDVTTKPFPGAHFAVYPPGLCEKPIKATCPEDGIVLDPFAGAGTTCLVAKRLGRRFVGIELNSDYVALAQKRVGIDVDEPERLLQDGQVPLSENGGFTCGDEP